MRAAILGVFAHEADLSNQQLIRLNKASTLITHTDPKAEYGALVIAFAARYGLQKYTIRPHEFLNYFTSHFPYDDEPARELIELIRRSVDAFERELSTADFCAAQGWTKGATGYIYHTVPAALYAWLRHPDDYRAGVLEIIHCGGDADSTAAIVGGLIGARSNKIPAEWVSGLCE
jgi:ADP-ribosyl-[dinitrogen reductase] hydrolase